MKTIPNVLSNCRLTYLWIALALVLSAGIVGAAGWGPGDILADTSEAAARTAAGECSQFTDARCKEWCWVLEPGLPPVSTGSFNCVDNATGEILDD